MLSLCWVQAWASAPAPALALTLTLALRWAPPPIPAPNPSLALDLPAPLILSNLLTLSLGTMPIPTLWPALITGLVPAPTRIPCPALTPALSPTLTPALPPVTLSAQSSLPARAPSGCRSKGHCWGLMAEGHAGTHRGLGKLCVVQLVKSSHCLLALCCGSPVAVFPLMHSLFFWRWEGMAGAKHTNRTSMSWLLPQYPPGFLASPTRAHTGPSQQSPLPAPPDLATPVRGRLILWVI